VTRISLGIAGAAGPELARELAPRLEAAGLHALWVNDTPGADALAVLAAAAEVTSTLVLATGVIPVDRRAAAEIARDVAAAGLPLDRLVLGIGAGRMRHGALDAVGAAVDELHAELGSADGSGGAAVMAGALGPRMRRLAFEHADGALLSWLSPATAPEAADGRTASAPAVLYARTIADPAARGALEEEAARYAGMGAYAAHFARTGDDPLATTLDLAARPDGLAALAGTVDELVLRAITPTGSVDEMLAIAEHPAVRALV
jgi:alkanesulfonate monooxygenase SsuD/methylene tetrahydromethanopterin reductase-like flavin-dependent oxidoreductase (luciferase family)